MWGGDGVQWSISNIEFDITGNAGLTINAVNAQFDTLVTVTRGLSGGDQYGYNIGLPHHSANYVGFEIVLDPDTTTNFFFHGYQVYLNKKTGGLRVK